MEEERNELMVEETEVEANETEGGKSGFGVGVLIGTGLTLVGITGVKLAKKGITKIKERRKRKKFIKANSKEEEPKDVDSETEESEKEEK